MQKYVRRLMKCGYSENKAYEICESFLRNFPLTELEFFVADVEKQNDVERVQS